MKIEEYEEAWLTGELEPCVPGDEEWERRLAMFLADERDRWWWLSFVDTDMPYTVEGDYPGGPRHLGICVVPGGNIVRAGHVAWALGCNPGGQVDGYPIPGAVKPEYAGRLFAGRAARDLAGMKWEDVKREEES